MKLQIIHGAILAAMLTLGACAPRPDAIAPVQLTSAFSGTTCDDAARMLQVELQRQAALYRAQNNAATADAIGVFLVAVPVGSLTNGDKTGDIATHKGKVLALQERLRNC